MAQPFDAVADALLVERDRLAAERARLLALRAAGCAVGGVLVCALDIGELQTRADASLGLIEQVERAAGVVLPAMERAGRADAAVAMGRRIIATTSGLDPFGDLVVDARRSVAETVRDASRLVRIGVGGAGLGLGIVAGVMLWRALR